MTQSEKKHKKIILVGNGAVGSAYAYALVNQNIGQELGIIDLDPFKVEGDVMDLNSALAFTAPKDIYVADYSDCADADLVVFTAGAGQKPGETRLDLIHKNLKITKTIVDQVMASGFNGIFLVASNPVDILSYAVHKFSGMPAHKVVGSGTSLDSARFRIELAKRLNIDARNVHGYIIGEHGDTEFPVWSHANIAGLQITEWLETNPLEDEGELLEIFEAVRDQAYHIIERKGATYYGIGAALAKITQAIFNNENSVLPLSVLLEGEYGHDDIYIGTPAIINDRGVKRAIEIPLNDYEQGKMNHSINTLRKFIQDAREKAPELGL